jgi:hypothetical protein
MPVSRSSPRSENRCLQCQLGLPDGAGNRGSYNDAGLMEKTSGSRNRDGSKEASCGDLAATTAFRLGVRAVVRAKEISMTTNPYRSPSLSAATEFRRECRQQHMSPWERALVLLHLGGIVIYVPIFVASAVFGGFAAGPPTTLIVVHFLLMALGLVVFVAIVRDLYLRDYFTPNQKLTWGLLFCLLSPSVWVYFFQHTWRPRNAMGTDFRGDNCAVAKQQAIE